MDDGLWEERELLSPSPTFPPLRAPSPRYEDFATNKTRELLRLFAFLGLPTRHVLSSAPSAFLKRSSTNRTQSLSNAPSVIRWLSEWGPPSFPALHVQMLRDVEYTKFDYDAGAVCMHMRGVK
jgi:hypothetical protein